MTSDHENAKRICYHVESKGSKWTVTFDHSGEEAQIFQDREQAIVAARAAAEARWEIYGLPSCVKVRGQDGIQYGDHSYG